MANILVQFPSKQRNTNIAALNEKYLENSDLVIKIGDLGFAREVEGMMNSFCGTPIHMAPEILENRIYNYKADISSLGVIIFELLTGVTPFNARDKKELNFNI